MHLFAMSKPSPAHGKNDLWNGTLTDAGRQQNENPMDYYRLYRVEYYWVHLAIVYANLYTPYMLL